MSLLIGLAFSIGYALVNHFRRSFPLSLRELLFGGILGIADNADLKPFEPNLNDWIYDER